MKPSDDLLNYAGTPLDQLPEELREAIENDSELKAEFEQQAVVAGMIALKRYEQPDDAMFGRVQYRVQTRLKNEMSSRPQPYLDRLPAWARMVAVVVVMLGLSVLTHREMLRAPSEDEQLTDSALQEAPQPVYPETRSVYDPIGGGVYGSILEGNGSSFGGLNRQLEADFEALGLLETNATETTLLPVMLPVGP